MTIISRSTLKQLCAYLDSKEEMGLINTLVYSPLYAARVPLGLIQLRGMHWGVQASVAPVIWERVLLLELRRIAPGLEWSKHHLEGSHEVSQFECTVCVSNKDAWVSLPRRYP